MFTKVVEPSFKSLVEVDKNIDSIITKICHNKWAKEVVAKHGTTATSKLSC